MPRKQRTSAPKRSAHEIVTDHIVGAIKAGSHGEYRTPWRGKRPLSRPVNAKSGKPYNGINILVLWATSMHAGYSSDKWATLKQWNDMGHTIRKGERSSPILFFSDYTVETATETGETETDRRIVARVSNGFNESQLEGYVDTSTTDVPADPLQSIAICDDLVTRTGATIEHGGVRAFYSPGSDVVRMPDAWRFLPVNGASRETHYYSTLFHELAHWSGAKSRLNRTKGKRFADREYAFEELVAELAAAFLCADLGVTSVPTDNTAEYLASWLRAFQSDPRMLISAASLASKAADYLQSLDCNRGSQLPSFDKPTAPSAPITPSVPVASVTHDGHQLAWSL